MQTGSADSNKGAEVEVQTEVEAEGEVKEEAEDGKNMQWKRRRSGAKVEVDSDENLLF